MYCDVDANPINFEKMILHNIVTSIATKKCKQLRQSKPRLHLIHRDLQSLQSIIKYVKKPYKNFKLTLVPIRYQRVVQAKQVKMEQCLKWKVKK